jgi:tetratricopeptide (TPR) repeat protein
VFFTRFNLKPVIAAPIYPPATVETDAGEDVLRSNPQDVEALSIDALKILVEIRLKNQQVKDAIIVMEQLISLLPDDEGLPLAKAFMHLNVKEPELAKLGFQEVLSKDPLCVKACDGLLMAAMGSESSSELKQIKRLIAEGMEKCKKERKKDILREFKFVLAQVFVFEEAYDDALKIYEELVKEERGDFRPYMSQGIIYTFLNKKEEAEKCFSKFKRLVPKGHPYYDYIDENMLQEVVSKKAELKSSVMVDEQVIEGDKDPFKVEEQVIEGDKDSFKVEEKVIDDERDALNTDEETVEDGIDSKKIEEEQVVEDDSGELRNEEDIVENEKASPSVSDEQAIRSE